MKKYILIIFVTLALCSSCSGLLDQYPHSAISPDAVTAKDLPAVRNGMYYAMQNYPRARSFIMFDILGGSITSSTYNPLDLINGVLSPLNSDIVSSWNGYYDALFQVNNMLDICDKFPSSPTGSLARGEAHFFRAYIYYCLATRWGGVPILRKNTMEKVARDPLEDVWSFIEEDLDIAISLLDHSASYYYASDNAATALKARVMLSQGKNAEAAALAESLIGEYKLDSFDKIFRKIANTEIIFAFENRTEESSINISDLFYTYGHPNKGQGSYKMTTQAVALFEDNDKRKEITVINIAGADCVNKYPSGQTGTDPVIVVRVAEMYLISAEAQGRVNGLSRLNELRKFRGLDNVNPVDDNAYMGAIIVERTRELLGENFAYYDLVRTGRAVTTLGILPYQQVFPIPGKELLLNPNLKPNPQY